VVREQVSTRRFGVLLVGRLRSMRGERAGTAADTVGALVAELARDDLADLSVSVDAVVLAHTGTAGHPSGSCRRGCSGVPAKGLTMSRSRGGRARELARVPAGSRVSLLSDCVHNAGPDQGRKTPAIPRLDVLWTPGESGPELAPGLARLGPRPAAKANAYRDAHLV